MITDPLATYARDEQILLGAFPALMQKDVKEVLSQAIDVKIWTEPLYSTVGNENLTIPRRVWAKTFSTDKLTDHQRIIYHAIFCRSTDGHVRESSTIELTKAKPSPWIEPYLFWSLSDYVLEVASIVPTNGHKHFELLHEFCVANPESTRVSKARAISFWSEHYRSFGTGYHDYAPYKLLDSLSR